MAHLPRDEFSPYFAIWERTANNGLWLSNFLDLLNGLPCKNPKIDHQEIEEFRTLRVKASYFICDDWCSGKDIDKDRDLWVTQVARANAWNFSFEVPNEFAAFVKNGRRSSMSYDEVCSLIDSYNFHILPSEEAIAKVKLYLQRLKELRAQVRKVIDDYLILDTKLEIVGWIDGKTYTYNPRELYEEFRSHYAYETALCIPMY